MRHSEPAQRALRKTQHKQGYLSFSTADSRLLRSGQQWLSPQARGYPNDPLSRGTTLGAISAYAELPTRPRRPPSLARVYPRVCEDTLRSRTMALMMLGLCPRLRGYPRMDRGREPHQRSIPADAGVSHRRHPSGAGAEGYPHVCGATSSSSSSTSRPPGPSPRLRGRGHVRKCALSQDLHADTTVPFPARRRTWLTHTLQLQRPSLCAHEHGLPSTRYTPFSTCRRSLQV